MAGSVRLFIWLGEWLGVGGYLYGWVNGWEWAAIYVAGWMAGSGQLGIQLGSGKLNGWVYMACSGRLDGLLGFHDLADGCLYGWVWMAVSGRLGVSGWMNGWIWTAENGRLDRWFGMDGWVIGLEWAAGWTTAINRFGGRLGVNGLVDDFGWTSYMDSCLLSPLWSNFSWHV